MTDHYLKETPLVQWEGIADRVEHKLWMTKPTPPSPALPLSSVALVEDASREQDVRPTEDGIGWSRGVTSIANEAPDSESVALFDPDLVALSVGASQGETDAGVPGPPLEHSVDEFAAAVAVPLAEGEGQTRTDEMDGRADVFLVQAPQRL